MFLSLLHLAHSVLFPVVMVRFGKCSRQVVQEWKSKDASLEWKFSILV